MTYSVLGTCGNCGGPVIARIGREPVNLNARCVRCQARPVDEFGPVIPMITPQAKVVKGTPETT